MHPALKSADSLIIRLAWVIPSDSKVQNREKCLVGYVIPLLAIVHPRASDLKERVAIQGPSQLLILECAGRAVYFDGPRVVIIAIESDATAKARVNVAAVEIMKRALVCARSVDDFKNVPLTAFRPSNPSPDSTTKRPKGRPKPLLLPRGVVAQANLGLKDHLVASIAIKAKPALESSRRPEARPVFNWDDV
ncbi:hypothetical protein MMC29_002993 [Sticta canariensis]|nr:hypothetical protein [Sticta canariensis]